LRSFHKNEAPATETVFNIKPISDMRTTLLLIKVFSGKNSSRADVTHVLNINANKKSDARKPA